MQRNIILLACFLVCSNCFAQQYPFVYYTPKEGLINSRVREIKQDSKGRMYFLTHGGLSVYDGKRFINYDRQQGLENELVNDIIEMAPDSFLLSTNVSKLNTLVRGRVGVFKTADNFYPVINRFFKSMDGHWYAAADEGLYRLDNNRFTKLPMKDMSGAEMGGCLDRMLEWKNYLLLIPWNTELKEKLIIYDRVTGKVSDIDQKTQIITATRDRQDRLWFATNDGLRLADTAALNKGKISYVPVPGQYKSMAGKKHPLLLFDQEKRSWFYSEGSITVFSPLQKKIIHPGPAVKNYSFSDFFVDREGSMWIATNGNGVMKLTNTNIEFLNSIDEAIIDCRGISSKNDTVWFYNFTNNSIYRLSENNFSRFPFSIEKAPGCNLYVHEKRIYIVTPAKIYRIENKDDRNSYRKAKIILQPNDSTRLGNGLIDKYGAIIQYVAEPYNQEYFLLVLKNDSVIMKQPISYAADQFTFDRLGRIWFTTRDNRVFAFTIHPGQPLEYLQPVQGYPKYLPNISPRAITIDSNLQIWIGTRFNGIYKLREKGDSLVPIEQFTTQHGLTDNFVAYLTSDHNNTIWAGTQTGLDRIYRKNDRYIIGNISKSNNFFQSVSGLITTSDNSLWGLTNQTILKISNTDISQITAEPPRLVLTTLEINNSPYHDSLKQFSYQDNNLSFNVAALSFIDEGSIQYSYLLQGSGHDAWSPASNNATFNFINLSPGDYVLKVKAEFPELIYPAQTMSYAFSIQPPWWKTWWFRAGISALVLSALVMLTRFYYSRQLEVQKNMLEKKQAVEKERTRIATDMHDELGAGLSRIKFLSETIGIKKQKQEAVKEDINKIRQYSHEMIDKMGEIVWALNEKNDSLSDLLAYTRVYAMQYLSENDIHCTVNLPAQFPSLFISGELRRNIYLTVKEALHNIVKHAQADQVTIDIDTEKQLNFSIHDNGTGFDPSNIRPYGNGLNNMKKRIASIEGTLHILNGNGTTVVFSVPLS
jgi:signal transduction histidine kinase